MSKIRSAKRSRTQEAYSEDIERKCRQQQKESLAQQIQEKEAQVSSLQMTHMRAIEEVENMAEYI